VGLAVTMGCAAERPSDEMPLGVLQIALNEVPADVLCIQFTVSDGLRRIVRRIPVTPGSNVTSTQSGLPVGMVSIAVDAYNASCASITDSSVATWVSGVIPATLVATMPVMLTINMSRPGSASVSVLFPSDGGADAPPGGVTILPPGRDFGAFAVGTQSPPQLFTVTNDAASAVGLAISVMSGALPAYLIDSNDCPAQVPAGATCTVGVRFTPPSTGVITGQFRVQTSQGVVATASLTGTGTVGASIMPPGRDFGAFAVGTQSPPQLFFITNDTTSTVTFTATTLSTAPPSFTIDSNGCSSPVPPGGSCNIGVRFTPVGTGVATGLFRATSSLGAVATGTLTGTGTVGASIMPPGRDFGAFAVGTQSPPQLFFITNDTTSTVTFTATTLSTAPPSFTIDSNGCSSPVPPGGSCNIGVRFTPVGTGIATGLFRATSSLGAVATGTLTGTGTVGAAITPPMRDFGALAVGSQSPPQLFTVTNQATSPVTFTAVATSTAPPSFALDSNGCASPVPVGGTCSVGIRFTPVGAGLATGLLRVTSTLGAVATAELSGTGTTSGAVISNLVVNDTSPGGDGVPNNTQWSVQANLQMTLQPFGDRSFTIGSIGNAVLTGKPWIKTAADSKSFTGNPLATFTLNGTLVYLIIDNRHNAANGRPPWLTDTAWVDQGFDVMVNQTTTTTFPYSVWRKSFTAGATVSLPPVGSSLAPGYFVVAQ
jgi:hypothetical protein